MHQIKLMNSLRALFVLAAIVGTASAGESRGPFPVRGFIGGMATVVDGDGLLFNNTEVRLQGIAAPEWRVNRHDKGGRESADHLRSLVEGHYIRCALDGTTTRKRLVGVCFLDGRQLSLAQINAGQGYDLGLAQVTAGHALDCPRYSRGRYAEVERRARLAGRDLAAIYVLPDYCFPH